MSKEDYYTECLAESFEEHGISATPEQLKSIGHDIAMAVEHQYLAFYEPGVGDYLTGENERLKKELKTERSKIGCRACGGSGRSRYMAGSWHVECRTCHGEGKVLA